MNEQELIEPKVNPNPTWKVNAKERLSACDNRPGLKKIYVTVRGDRGESLQGVTVGFETEPSYGVAYDHMDVWGLTDQRGHIEWDHLGVPTRYVLWMEDDEIPLIENIRTDLGNEYCPSGSILGSWRPVNRPGIYSYRFEIQKVGAGELPVLLPPVISNVGLAVLGDQQDRGYARVIVSFTTDVEAEAQVYYSLFFEGGVGGEMQPVCDPFSVGGWRSAVSGPGLNHVVELWGGSLWYSSESSKRYCLVVVAWFPAYRHGHWLRGYSPLYSFTLPSV